MQKLIVNTLYSYVCGMCLGVLLGFGDINGIIYYDLKSGITAGAILGCVFALTCWIVGFKELRGE